VFREASLCWSKEYFEGWLMDFQGGKRAIAEAEDEAEALI